MDFSNSERLSQPIQEEGLRQRHFSSVTIFHMNDSAPIAIVPSQEMGNMIHISWMLHNKCNKRCSYCRDFNWNGDFEWLKFERVKLFIDKILSHFQKDTYHFSFTGGEPTLWPHFEELCHYLHEKNCVIGLTTNGSMGPAFWQSIAHTLNWISISYHPESGNDESIIRLLKIVGNHARPAVRVMMHKEPVYWEKSVQFAEKLKSITDVCYIYVEYVPLQDDFGLDSRPTKYAEWQNEFFRNNNNFTVHSPEPVEFKHGVDVWNFQQVQQDKTKKFCRPNELVASNLVNFQNWTCYAGIDLLFVNHEGNILRGACRQGGIIGNIMDKNLKLPTKPIICKADFCPCATDILVKKYHPGYSE